MLPTITPYPRRGAGAGCAQGQPFDVAILDMQMPEMDGLTLATEIRALGGHGAAPAPGAC